MRLHLGCGKYILPGFLNIDIEKHSGVDIVGDFRTMDFKNVEEIQARHLLEHFGRDESLDVLKQWHSWLMLDGQLLVETRDFELICEEFKYDKEWMTRHAFGSQEAEWAFHRDGWWADKFKEVFPKIGFEIVLLKKTKSRVWLKNHTEKHVLPNIVVVAKKI